MGTLISRLRELFSESEESREKSRQFDAAIKSHLNGTAELAKARHRLVQSRSEIERRLKKLEPEDVKG